jgi:hypothetical protein
MDLVAELQKLRKDHPDAIVYSNYVDAVWFYTRKPVFILPFADVPDPAEVYVGWPDDKPGYVVWFEPNEYKHYLSPEDLAKFANLKLIYQGSCGKIYYVKSRKN